MNAPIIDAHIHFDLYSKHNQQIIIDDMKKTNLRAMISVSKDIISSQDNLSIAQKYNFLKPAFGFHPEQKLPSQGEIEAILTFIDLNHQEMIAIGEVGLPYYLSRKNITLNYTPYIEILEQFIRKAARLNKPIILHAVYDDADLVCGFLEQYSIKKAHFHWFKGSREIQRQIIDNGYFISITPDVLYTKEIQQLVKYYPLSLMMVETDGPWKFNGPFKEKMTHPKMIHAVIQKIAEIKNNSLFNTYHILYENTKTFYDL